MKIATLRRNDDRSPIADAVEAGLRSAPKRLPPTLFYDAHGAELYERITELPEYYPTRTERAIFAEHATEIVDAARGDRPEPLRVVELGAGTATKTELLLAAVVARQGTCTFVPVDVADGALDEAASRIARQVPGVDVRPLHATHHDAFPEIARLRPLQFALFIGSSIGNYEDAAARELLVELAGALRPGAPFLLGTDMCRDPEILIPAYDDAEGVTAAFNLNLLERLNRELGADFDRTRFRHRATWNAERSRVEMHLESLRDQIVRIEDLDLEVSFQTGETIHTESSVKYDLPMVERLLASAGFALERTFHDPARRFGVHLARRR